MLEVVRWVAHAARWTWADPAGYNIFSGPLPDLAMLTGIGAFFRHVNCHVGGCRRFGHRVPGTPYRACRQHHPSMSDETVTAAHIDQAYRSASSIDRHGRTGE